MSRFVASDALILDRGRNSIHQLNVTAVYIWERCDGRHSVEEIAESLAVRCGVDTGTAKVDVAGAILKLEELGLLDAPVARPA